MKFIKNSIDSENLQDSISNADLEMEMTSFEVKPELLNGHHSKEGGHTCEETNVTEVVKVAEISNGVHGKASIPTKCNGKVNGFYDEEEDFQLVLEDSSEEGGSPSKKIDDDTISAPQIVQEIEDLLGINSSSAGIQEELNNLDGIESIEDNLENDEDIDNDTNIASQEITEVFEEIEEDKLLNCEEVGNKKEGTIEENKKMTDKVSEKTECDNSPHLNIVYDEVEVGSENRDCQNVKGSSEDECKVESSTDTNRTEKLENVDKSKDTISQEDVDIRNENYVKDDVLIESTSAELPLTQSSNFSESSAEWMVIDAIETSDEEKSLESQDSPKMPNISNNQTHDAEKSNNHDDLQSEVQNSICDLKTTDKIEDMVESKSELERRSGSPALVPSKGEGIRKRCAVESDAEIELKKPKLEEESSLVESSSPVLKRSLIDIVENESKRTKISETAQECKIGSSEECNLQSEHSEEMNIGQIKTESSRESQDINDLLNSKNIKGNVLYREENDKNEGNSQQNEIQIKTDCSSDTTMSESRNSTVLAESIVDAPQLQVKLQPDVVPIDIDQKSEIDSTSLKYSSMTSNINEITIGKDVFTPNTESMSHQNFAKALADDAISSCEESQQKNEDKIQDLIVKEEKSDDENKENVSSTIIDSSTNEASHKLQDISPNTSVGSSKLKIKINEVENNTQDMPQSKSSDIGLTSSINELEKSLLNSKHEKGLKSLESNHTEPKKMTNLDLAIERVVEKSRLQTEKKVPILKKFHKDQLKKLTKSELEDIVVSKICEAVTYKSEIGQMRLRTQNLEETNDMWRKKVQQVEKQNRELEMVLKRFLAEIAHIKRENQNKVPMPVKVTRSVGLQVVLASSMNGALVSSKNKSNSESSCQQQQTTKAKPVEKEEKVKEPEKSTPFLPPPVAGRGRGRPSKTATSTPQNSRPSTPQSPTPKFQVIPGNNTPVKPATIAPVKPATPVKTIPTPNKDLEVIDLTEKEERAKSSLQNPLGGSIRVAPSTQVCFVQQSAAPSSAQQMTYLVQNSGQRSQLLVATSSAGSQRPIPNISLSRQPPHLALPVFRAGGQLIPVRTSPQVGVRTNSSPVGTTSTATRQVTQALRVQSQTSVKHPAPLPSAPIITPKPGMKAPPPKPQLKIAKTVNGIMLSWSMSLTKDMAEMASYQLYAYQEGNQPPSTGLWKKVGDVKALPLPMACTLTQFIEGHKYHFAVRAVDVHTRVGPFSSPSSILLTK